MRFLILKDKLTFRKAISYRNCIFKIYYIIKHKYLLKDTLKNIKEIKMSVKTNTDA